MPARSAATTPIQRTPPATRGRAWGRAARRERGWGRGAGAGARRGADALLRVLPVLLGVEAEAGDVPVLQRLGEAWIRLPLHIDEPAGTVGEQRIDLVRLEAQRLLDGPRGCLRVSNLPRVRIDRRRA